MTVDTATGEITDSDQILNYEIHPVAALFPYIEGDAFREFVEDIRVNGQREAVVVDKDGRLLDGRNRARACAALGIDVKERRYVGEDVESWIISHNVHRRHLNESQRAMIAARLATMRQGERTDLVSIDTRSTPTREEAARRLNVGSASVGRARSVLNSGDTELIQAVESGEVSVTKAAEKARAAVRDTEPVVAARKSRADKADLLEDLAAQGYSSRQMVKALGFSRDEQVRKLAREYGIEIPADRSVNRTRHIDSTRIVTQAATALEGLVMGFDLIDYASLDPEEVSQWTDSLTTSVNALSKAVKKIKESIQ